MGAGYQTAITAVINRIWSWMLRRRGGQKLYIGARDRGGGRSRGRVGIPMTKRSEHIALLGKTGTGKTSLLRYMCWQDIQKGHGFAFFDLHGDTTPYLLSLIASEEGRRHRAMDDRVIVIDPCDPERTVGLNILQAEHEQEAFVEIAEVTAILKHRWKLEALGVRTEELLRHSLLVLISNDLTLLEMGPLLTTASFRARCVRTMPASEARAYFETRYDRLSPEMQAVYREAILNKVSLYASDPRFRHLLGQRKSTVNLKGAIDSGAWILINLEKGRLGEEAATLGALLLAKLKHAILGRNSRRLFTLYCDELQNLVAYDGGIDVLLSEARKFGVGIVSANQYLDQYSTAMRAAVLAMGSHAFLQLSGPDARRIAYWLGGGHALADRLRINATRHVLVQQADGSLDEAVVPTLPTLPGQPLGLLRRSRDRWTTSRQDVNAAIAARHAAAAKETLDDTWT